MLSYIGVVLLCIVSMFTVSCENKETARKHDLTPKSESVKVVLTDQDKKEIEAFAIELEESIYDENRTFFSDRFDLNRLYDIAMKGLELKAKERVQFKRGLSKNKVATKEGLVNIVVSSDAHYLKIVHKTKPALLFRIILEDGSFTYCEFILARNKKNSNWDIVDLFFYGNGKPTSDIVREAAAQLMPNKGKIDSIMMKAFEQAKQVNDLVVQGNAKKAWSKWKKINPKAYKSRIVVVYGYNAAAQIYVDDLASENSGKELKEIFAVIQKEFPSDPGFALLELGIHEINEDYDKFRETLERVREMVGDDPYLLLQESLADIGEEKFDEAIKKIDAFEQLEPDSIYVYDVYWAIYLANKDHKSMRESLTEFTELYETEKSFFSEDPNFKEFINSPEGQAWLKE